MRIRLRVALPTQSPRAPRTPRTPRRLDHPHRRARRPLLVRGGLPARPFPRVISPIHSLIYGGAGRPFMRSGVEEIEAAVTVNEALSRLPFPISKRDAIRIVGPCPLPLPSQDKVE